jgi:protein-S-isoprenylcysteine O-methyltransferase Ste14
VPRGAGGTLTCACPGAAPLSSRSRQPANRITGDYNAAVTTSSSTARIRRTQLLFLAAIVLVALSGGRALEGAAGLAAQWLGFVLVTAGTLYRMWSSVFIAGRKDVEIVREGPYARCRHPLYLGSLVAGLGLALSTRSLVLALALPAVLAGLLAQAIRREERFLARRHGDAWADYAARVPALWPSRPGTDGPQRREVDLAIYRKAFLDAATVLGLWLVIVAVDTLRTQGAWTPLFRLP